MQNTYIYIYIYIDIDIDIDIYIYIWFMVHGLGLYHGEPDAGEPSARLETLGCLGLHQDLSSSSSVAQNAE